MDELSWTNNRKLEFSQSVSELHNLPWERITKLGDTIFNKFKSGNKISFVGNGGSAAEAMHLAAEFTGKCVLEHPAFAALCLNESQSSITAIANDFGFEYIFARQVQAHLRKGDLIVILSTSGKSKNIQLAIEAAIALEVDVILWTGINAPDFQKVNVWRVNSMSTPRIQEIHLVWGHLVAEYVEYRYANESVINS